MNGHDDTNLFFESTKHVFYYYYHVIRRDRRHTNVTVLNEVFAVSPVWLECEITTDLSPSYMT